MQTLLLVLISLLLFGHLSAETATASAFVKEGIMPDLVKTVPNEQLQIQYGNKSVQLGNLFKLSEVAGVPKVEWPTQTDKLYALIKVDPDARSRKNPIYRSWLHWMILNIPGSQLEKGHTVVTYKGAGAPPETGLHRYVFLIYEQKAELTANFTEFSNENRKNFNVEKFAEENQLGAPLYGNFYVARHED